MRASPPGSYASICFSKPKYLIYSSVHACVFLYTDINTIFPIIMPLSESTDDQTETRRKKTAQPHEKSLHAEADACCFYPKGSRCRLSPHQSLTCVTWLVDMGQAT